MPSQPSSFLRSFQIEMLEPGCLPIGCFENDVLVKLSEMFPCILKDVDGCGIG